MGMDINKNNEKGVRKGTWTKEEDSLLTKCIDKYGEGKWHLVPLRAGLNRCRKSCRLRWLNYLRPNIKRGHFTKDEVDLIIRLHNLLGNRWSLIAGRLPGRTANDVKNFWNTRIEKKIVVRNIINDNKIIRPRPHNLSESNAPWVMRETCNKTECHENSSSHGKLQQQSSSSAELDQVDECIQWWSNLLHQTTQDGDGFIAPFSL